MCKSRSKWTGESSGAVTTVVVGYLVGNHARMGDGAWPAGVRGGDLQKEEAATWWRKRLRPDGRRGRYLTAGVRRQAWWSLGHFFTRLVFSIKNYLLHYNKHLKMLQTNFWTCIQPSLNLRYETLCTYTIRQWQQAATRSILLFYSTQKRTKITSATRWWADIYGCLIVPWMDSSTPVY